MKRSPSTASFCSSALVLSLAWIASASSSLPACASDWAQWRGPAHNSISNETGLNWKWSASGPERLWQVNIGKSYAAVAVSDGRVFTMGSANGKETVYCFDADTGSLVWKHAYDHAKRAAQADPNPTASGATPVVDGNRVFSLSREGLALCLDAKAGKVLWQNDLVATTKAKQPYFGFTGAALVQGDLVLYNVGYGGCALDKTSGKIVWKSAGGEAGYSTPVPFTQDGKSAVLLTTGTGVVAVESKTGKKLWDHTWKTRFDVNAIDPILSDGQLFITAYDRSQMLKVSGNKVTVAFEPRNMKSTYVTPLLIDGHMYGNDNGFLRCVEWKTGKTLWGERGMGSGALIAVGKDLLALTENGELWLVEATPEKFVQKAKAKVMEGKCWTQPVLANGRLYCRNNDGDLVCLNLRTR